MGQLGPKIVEPIMATVKENRSASSLIQVRVTPEEKEQLQDQLGKAGISAQVLLRTFIQDIIRNQSVPDLTFVEPIDRL